MSELKMTRDALENWWRRWNRRREWTPERQLEHLLMMVQSDHRWLAHDKVADALTTRYLAALAPDWMGRTHADSWQFRQTIGLEPDYTLKMAWPVDVLERMKRIESGEVRFGDGPLPETGWDEAKKLQP